MRMENWPENVVLVHLPREVHRHTELDTTIDAVRKTGDFDVVVDFSEVDIVGSPTFSRLLELRNVLRQSGHRLVLCHADPATKSVFVTTELDRLFEFAESESAALATLRANG